MEVRVLPGPPRIRRAAEISQRPPNRADSAPLFNADPSPRRRDRISVGVSARLSPLYRTRFPERETVSAETRFDSQIIAAKGRGFGAAGTIRSVSRRAVLRQCREAIVLRLQRRDKLSPRRLRNRLDWRREKARDRFGASTHRVRGFGRHLFGRELARLAVAADAFRNCGLFRSCLARLRNGLVGVSPSSRSEWLKRRPMAPGKYGAGGSGSRLKSTRTTLLSRAITWRSTMFSMETPFLLLNQRAAAIRAVG